ncbi:hypothetical protein [Pectobacterium odoriferum]|uniref:hypothetical protein n=1 Tax=Pectobacterium odoriferum TaxID=78398 RepID=UPI001CF42BFF|nr:hypothetical protein [Pectobacterium odoriferum]MCA6962534.1 hypothetical protein [Pectobacterium odoriferum]MCH5010629.1 hypothetical protein [Pectobacterium odoriferum]
MALSYRSIARTYGYDESTVRQSWAKKGMPDPKSSTENEIRQWIVINILNPLRDTDTQEQIQRERLRKLTAEAEQAEISVRQCMDELIEITVVQNELSSYLKRIRDHLRTIPNKTYLELFEQEKSIDIKRVLQSRIDEVLNECGRFNYEVPQEENNKEDEHTEDKEDN